MYHTAMKEQINFNDNCISTLATNNITLLDVTQTLYSL